MARTQQTCPDPHPVELPVGLRAWLLECAPAADCETCRSEAQRLEAADERGDVAQAARHAANIRRHTSGDH
ncbi:hypothetical protein ACLMNJ_20545 [Streptomyces seoulensis]